MTPVNKRRNHHKSKEKTAIKRRVKSTIRRLKFQNKESFLPHEYAFAREFSRFHQIPIDFYQKI